MKKQMKKVFAIVMALTMVFAMSASAFAADGAGDYIVGEPNMTSAPINVKVVIESKQFSETDTTSISDILDVQVTTKSAPENGYTVRDAMLAVSNDSANGITAYNEDGVLLSEKDVYIKSMQKDGKKYAPALPFEDPEMDMALDGWAYRVNGKLPLKSRTEDPVSGGPLGTDIATTPIHDGDIIHFYWEYPYQESATPVSYYSTDFLTASTSYDKSTDALTIQMKKSFGYFDNSNFWHISSFENYAKAEAGTYDYTIYKEDGSIAKTGIINKAEGSVVLQNSGLGEGTYYLKINSTSYYDVTGSDIDWEDVIWHILDTTMVYEKFTIKF